MIHAPGFGVQKVTQRTCNGNEHLSEHEVEQACHHANLEHNEDDEWEHKSYEIRIHGATFSAFHRGNARLSASKTAWRFARGHHGPESSNPVFFSTPTAGITVSSRSPQHLGSH
jgi:hypothetical protein